LRAAGLVARLEAAGFQVNDLGDGPTHVYAADDEHPRARNTAAVVDAMSELRLKVEQAVKSGALSLILGGDCAITPGTIAGARRYYRDVGLMWLDRDADLNTPATTPSGCLHGMTVAHITGRGAPEIVRFYTEAPLIRDPGVALFGLERLDPGEEKLLATTPIRSFMAADILRRGVAATAHTALDRIHASATPFVLHFDVDVTSSEDFAACSFPGASGLRIGDVRQALGVFVAEPQLLAIEISEYFPDRDPDGSAAKLLVEMIASALEQRLAALTAPKAEPTAEAAPAESSEVSAEEHTADAAATTGDPSSNSSV
jgi:arginase